MSLGLPTFLLGRARSGMPMPKQLIILATADAAVRAVLPARFRTLAPIGLRCPVRPRCLGDAGGLPGQRVFAQRNFHPEDGRESTGFGEECYLYDLEIIERLLF